MWELLETRLKKNSKRTWLRAVIDRYWQTVWNFQNSLGVFGAIVLIYLPTLENWPNNNDVRFPCLSVENRSKKRKKLTLRPLFESSLKEEKEGRALSHDFFFKPRYGFKHSKGEFGVLKFTAFKHFVKKKIP